MSTVSFTSKEFLRRFRKALSVPFMLDQACSTAIQEFIKSYASSIGCSEKCILFPLLTCCAACMGPHSVLELAPNWQEVPIVWTLVLTPMTLHRIDVAEHIKQQILTVQNELASAKSEEASHPPCEKFVVDVVTVDELKETLRSNDGQALGIYNTTRIFQNNLETAHDIEIIQRLHLGSSWFSSSKVTKKLLSKTHVNFSILSKPSAAYHSLSNVPNFHEVYQDCFLTICAEENHVKFSQLSSPSQSDTLCRIFKEIINIHCSEKMVYKLSEEGAAKFSQIHDEITDKAKQLARKSVDKVFYPALSYLGRLSCILHVLDNAIEAVKWNMPADTFTWTTEISADTVWRARQVLGYVIEQKFVLSQPTMVESSPAPNKSVEPVTVIDGNATPSRVASARTNLFTPPRTYVPLNRANSLSPRNFHTSPQRGAYSTTSSRGRSVMSTYPRPGRPPTNSAFDLLLESTRSSMPNNVQSNSANPDDPIAEPMISEVRSAGVPVPVNAAVSSNTADNGITLLPNMSMTILPDSGPESGNQSVSNGTGASVTPQSVAMMTDDEFFRAFKVQIRRILTHGMKDISLSVCVDLKFAPKPTGGYQSADQKTAMARVFLKRLESLGFGILEGANGTGPARLCIFKKRRFSVLGDKQRTMLSELRVNERDYDKCFSVSVQNGETGNSGSVVCLE